MKPERWQSIEQLYHAALEREADERGPFLMEACADDAELRREVEVLLAANDEASGFLATPALEQEAKNIAAEMPAAQLGLQVGQELSHYKILSRIGAGGMGEVFLAEDMRLDRKVAIKFLPSYLEADEVAKKRLVKEAKAAASLDHPNICTVYEVGNYGNLPFIAMQNIEGKTIQQMLSRSPLPIESALRYALDIADALDEAHRRGIIHRDIKPSNIIVNERDRAVVLDFGLAKQIPVRDSTSEEAPTLLQLTTEMTILGTPAYMSPEQVRREALDSRSDIFSFGALFYEMLTGTIAFPGEHPVDILHSILHDAPKPVSEARPQAGYELDRVVQKCLSKERDKRYPSFAELKSDVLEVIERGHYKAGRGSTEEHRAERAASGAANKTASAAALETRKLTAAIKHSLSSLTWRPVAVVIAVAVLLITAWWFLIRPRPVSDSALIGSLTHTQLINWKDQGGILQDSHGVLSPDGKVIAYRSRASGKSSILTKQIGGGDARDVVSDEWNNKNPVWSPDGQEIAFISDRGNKPGIWRIPAFGGTPTQITSLDGPGGRDIELRHWSKDSGTVYYRTDKNLFSLDIATKATTQITNLDPSVISTRYFSISPREDQIAYVDSIGGQRDLWVMPMAGGRPTQVTSDAEDDLYPAWHPDGKRIIYSSKRDGIFQICIAYPDGREPLKITTGESDSFVSDVSTDGTRILYSGSREESDIWAVNVDTGEERQITSDVSAELWADVSPDGKRVAFQSVKQLSQSSNLYKSLLLISPLDTDRGQIQLAAEAVQPRWSPDNQSIAFLRTSNLVTAIWSVSAVGGDEKQLTKRTVSGFLWSTLPYNRFNTGDFSWSPDSSRISYCSEVPEPGLWVCTANGQSDVKLTGETGAGARLSSPLWSPDGERIAYVSHVAGEKATWSASVSEVKTGESKIIYQGNSVVRLLGWSPDGALFIATIENQPNVWQSPAQVKIIQVSVQQGDARPIATTDSAYLYSTHLSPDARLIVFVSRQEGKGNIWVVSTEGGQARKLTTNTDPKLYFSSIAWSPDAKTIYFDKQSRYSLIYMISNFR